MWQRCCWDTRALQVCDKLWRAVAEASHVSLFNKTRAELRVVALAAPTSNRRNRDWALLGATFSQRFLSALLPLDQILQAVGFDVITSLQRLANASTALEYEKRPLCPHRNVGAQGAVRG